MCCIYIHKKNSIPQGYTVFVHRGPCELSTHDLRPCKGILTVFQKLVLGMWVGNEI